MTFKVMVGLYTSLLLQKLSSDKPFLDYSTTVATTLARTVIDG